MARDDYPDVDFSVGRSDPGADEDLPQPRDRDWALLRHARRPLGCVAAIAAIVLGMVKLTSVDHRSTTAAAPTRTPVGPTHVAPIVPTDPAVCPPVISCISSDTAPADVRAAVRAAFPGAQQQSATTVLDHNDSPGSRLWFRQIRAGSSDLAILVRVLQPRPDASLRDGITRGGDRTVSFVAVRSHGLVVQVQVDSPSGSVPGVDALRKLAADRRLLVPA